MFALTVVLIAAAMGFNYSVNPYGAWRRAMVDPIFRNLTGDRAQMPYQLWTTAPETLLIGSSRVQEGLRIEQGYRAGVLNASLGAAGIQDLARIVVLALRNPKLKRIVWGVDFYAFNGRRHHVNPSFDERIALQPDMLLEDSLVSLSAMGDSFDELKRALRGRRNLKATMAANVPWPRELICAQLIAQRKHGLAVATPANIEIGLAQVHAWFYANYEFSPAIAARFREVVQAARARKVEVILFVPPMSEYELEVIRQGGLWPDFERFKRAVAAAGPLWDFAAYNRLATADDLFLDVLHLKPAAGNEILRIMFGMEPASCGVDAEIISASAVRVDSGSINGVLALEARARDQATAVESRYSRIAAVALRKSAGRQFAVGGH
jgi:hypothetical protein